MADVQLSALGAVIKTAYEGESNTNAYTDAEKTKLAGIQSGAQVNTVTSVNGDTGVVVLTASDVGAATTAQGAKADTAVQPGSLATVATSGAYNDLSGKPTLGTAAAENTSAFATSAQGAKADTALQSVVAGSNVTIDDTDPLNPIISATGGGGGGGGDVNGPASSTDNAIARFNGTGGKTLQNSGATIDDSGNLTANNFSGTSSGTNTGDQTTITGNAGSATVLQTSRNINGVAFNGSANITVTAAADTLTGTTLNSSVVTSSLTAVGTLTTGTWNATVIAANKGGAGTVNGIMKANGSGTVSAAVSGTDYAPATSGSAILKGNGSGGFSSATAGTDYLVSNTAGVTGADAITNIMSLTTAEYTAIGTPNASTLYIITDA